MSLVIVPVGDTEEQSHVVGVVGQVNGQVVVSKIQVTIYKVNGDNASVVTGF
jgi:hypothetical protein